MTSWHKTGTHPFFMTSQHKTNTHPFLLTSWHKTGAHPFYIGMYIHIYTHIYVHKNTSQKECLHIFRDISAKDVSKWVFFKVITSIWDRNRSYQGRMNSAVGSLTYAAPEVWADQLGKFESPGSCWEKNLATK